MDRTRSMSFDPSRITKAAAARYSSSDSDSDEGDDSQVPSTDPNADEFNDYNPRKRRRTGRNTKESAALGIFGSESEDDGPGNRWKHKELRNKGMTFVSSTSNHKNGSEQEGLDEDQEEGGNDSKGMDSMRARASDDEDDEDEEENGQNGGLGLNLGLGLASQRVSQDFGWSAANRGTRPPPQPSKQKDLSSTKAPLGRGFVPTSSFMPELKAQEEDTPAPQITRPSAFSSNVGKVGKAGGKPNPSSFGAKMMAKMGYKEGSGLGKEGQGRNVIIEANLRPQRAGLGVVKEKTETERQEEKRQARLRGEVVVDSDEEEKKRKAARKKKLLSRGSSTPASGASTPKRQKPKFLTLDQVKKAAPGLNIPDAFTPILDLTGPGRKMLTSSSGLMTPTGAAASTETTEQAEERRLARRAHNDFIAIVEEWQGLQDRKAYVELQLQQQRQELEGLELGLAGYKSTVERFNALTLSSDTSDRSSMDEAHQRWDQMLITLKEANNSLPESSRDAQSDELAAITISTLHPLFRAVLQTWDPLQDPGLGLVSDLSSIRDLLGLQPPQSQFKQQQRRSTATAYETMMYQLWLPHIARSVREWDVRDSEQLVTLFEAWTPLLSDFVRSELLENYIVRRLDEAVTKWEPKRKSRHHTLPHIWLFPWLQHFPSRHLDPRSSTGLVADVKRKFRQLIEVWDFSRGVVPGLEKWKDILRPSRKHDEWRPLVMGHVLPSMARYLRKNFEVDPGDQGPFLPMLAGVFKWLDLISPSMIGEVVVAEVFPKWHDTLYSWLINEEVEYTEVFEWVEWWEKEVLPDDMKGLSSINAEFEKATSLIRSAITLGERASYELDRPHRGPALAIRKSPPPSQFQTPVRRLPEEPVTFRHRVEDWCQLHDLQFIPERSKVHAEGPLYRITARGDGRGGILGYFKGDTFRYELNDGTIIIRSEGEFEKLVGSLVA